MRHAHRLVGGRARGLRGRRATAGRDDGAGEGTGGVHEPAAAGRARRRICPPRGQGFRAHAADLGELVATFGAAHDFTQTGDRAYFSLPTTWTGLDAGKRFEEHGAWAFVLQRTGTADAVRWRILSYGWGVTAYTESP